MLTQIYEVTSAQEAAAISEMGVDHIGVLVGDGSFPREQPVASAVEIAASIRRPSKLSALFLSADLAFVVRAILASSSRRSCTWALRPSLSRRSMSWSSSAGFRRPWSCEACRWWAWRASTSLGATRGLRDFLLLDSYRANDKQIGALGVTHDWSISRQIVERVRVPVILAGGLGPDNVADAIRAFVPPASNSKTKTDKGGHAHERLWRR